MSDIIPNVVVSMPSQLFTLARKFQAASNGKIFIGEIDTDPTIPENQIQVYLENEDGTTVPVSQPLIINQAGYPVYNGQIAKFVTVQGHSMAVYDSYGAQQFYYPNVLKYDPDQAYHMLRSELSSPSGVSMIGGAVYRVDSVDIMLSSLGFSPRPGDVCITSGYYTKGDGGGAEYVYDESNSSADDGFITHKAISGGAWVLIDNRSRLPLQVAGVKADGVTDDREAFISALKSKRKLSLSGVMVISGDSINLSDFSENQSLGIDISGTGTESRIDFTSGDGGFHATEFFRDLTLKNLSIDNAAKDKKGAGFTCPKGAEYISWENVTFRFWKIGFDVHAWNSTLSGVDVRGCQYGGLFSGTSLTCTSGYAHSCDYGWMLGFRYNKDGDTISRSPQALSYSNFLSLAADNCGISYKAGMVQGVNLGSSGAEGYQGDCVVDLSEYPPRTFRASLTISQLDIYVENSSSALLSIIKEPSFDYGVYGSVLIKDCRMYSDRDVPLFNRSGMGFGISNTGFSREITRSDTSGISMPDNIQVGNAFDGIDSSGVNIGNYIGLKKTKAIVSVSKATSTSRVIIRVHDSSINFARGVSAFGVVKFFPVNNQAANAGADCGSVQFSVASDYAGGMDSVNAQKAGKLDTVSVYKRTSGSVIELAFAINNTIDYIAEIDFWSNGRFNSGNKSYYIEKQ